MGVNALVGEEVRTTIEWPVLKVLIDHGETWWMC